MVEPTRRTRIPMPRQSQVFFFLILALMLYLSWQVFRDFVIYIITGIFVAVLALPIDKFWERLFPNRVAAVFTMTTLFLIITVPLLLLGITMYKDATRLADAVQGSELQGLVNQTLEKPWAQKLVGMFNASHDPAVRAHFVDLKVQELQAWIHTTLTEFGTDLLSALPDFLVAMTVMLFVVYYVLTDGETFAAYLRRAVPLPGRQVDFLLHEARQGLSAVFVGQILLAIMQGVLGGIGFFIAGLPNAVLWGAVMAILALLPVVGTFLVWVPAGFYLIAKGQAWQGVFMLLWGAFVVMILMDNFVKPKLIGRRADIHPMFVLVGILGGAAAFGFIGLFLGPLLVGVTIAVLKVYEADYLDPEVNLLDEHVSDPGFPDEPADPDTAPLR
ncbi:MAG: AI-2E family transporter [Halobacteriales archaeon]|nr:AI-2E family transporter [Halobacteriales archaeon]